VWLIRRHDDCLTFSHEELFSRDRDPDLALQNPHLIPGVPYYAFPKLKKILLSLDQISQTRPIPFRSKLPLVALLLVAGLTFFVLRRLRRRSRAAA